MVKVGTDSLLAQEEQRENTGPWSLEWKHKKLANASESRAPLHRPPQPKTAV